MPAQSDATRIPRPQTTAPVFASTPPLESPLRAARERLRGDLQQQMLGDAELRLEQAKQIATPEAARRLRLQAETGMPLEYIEAYPDDVERALEEAKLALPDIAENAPGLLRWFVQSPEHAALARPNLQQLSTFGRILDDTRRGKTIGRLREDQLEPIMRLWAGTASLEDEQAAARFAKEIEGLQRDSELNFFAATPGNIAEQLDQIFASTTEAGVPAATVYGTGIAAEKIGQALLRGPTPITKAAGAASVTVGKAAQKVSRPTYLGGMMVAAGRREGAYAFYDISQLKDSEGNPMPRDVAVGAGLVVASLAGPIEMIGELQLMKNVPVLRQLVDRKRLRELLRNPATGPVLRAYFANIGKAMAGEGATEALQSIVQQVATRAATFVGFDEVNADVAQRGPIGALEWLFDGIDWGEVGHSAAIGASVGGGLSTVTGVATTAVDLRRVHTAQQFRTRFEEAVKAADGITVPEGDRRVVLPEMLGAAVREGQESVWFDPEAFDQLAQSAEVDADQLAAELLGGNIAALKEARDAGTPLAVPIAEVIAKLSGTPKLRAWVADNVMESPLAYSFAEAKAAMARLPDAAIAIDAERAARRDLEAPSEALVEEVRTSVTEKLKASKRSRSEQRVGALLWAARTRSLLSRGAPVEYVRQLMTETGITAGKANATVEQPGWTLTPENEARVAEILQRAKAPAAPVSTVQGGQEAATPGEAPSAPPPAAEGVSEAELLELGRILTGQEAAAPLSDPPVTPAPTEDVVPDEGADDAVRPAPSDPAEAAARAEVDALQAARQYLQERGVAPDAADRALEQRMPAATIEIDGVQRPTTDSTGGPIALTEKALRNFWRWFGESKIVDEQGRPRVIYHGTMADVEFTRFKWTPGQLGAHVGTTAEQANQFAQNQPGIFTRPRIMPLYLRAENPLRLNDHGHWTSFDTLAELRDGGIISTDEYAEALRLKQVQAGERASSEVEKIIRRGMRRMGYDSVVYLNRFEGLAPEEKRALSQWMVGNGWSRISDLDEATFRQHIPSAADSYIPLSGLQLKSAYGNSGRFSLSNADIYAQLGPTVDVDGVQRPTMNAAGRRIHPTEEGTRNFWRWYGDSKAVDAEGRPLVQYHGTESTEIAAFRPWSYAAVSPAYASDFASYFGEGANVMPLYVRTENPLNVVDLFGEVRHPIAFLKQQLASLGVTFTGSQLEDFFPAPAPFWALAQQDFVRDAIVKAGYDGVVMREFNAGMMSDAYLVPSGSQLKSATGNSGAFRGGGVLDQPMMSTRTPWVKEPLEDPLADDLLVDVDVIMSDEKFFEKILNTIPTYRGFRTRKGETKEQALERFIQQGVDNLLWLHDQVPEQVRNQTKRWYDGARKIAAQWAVDYGKSDAQMAAIIAVFSPQTEWFRNVSRASRFAEILTTQQRTVWTDAMTAQANVMVWNTVKKAFEPKVHPDILAQVQGRSLSELKTPQEIARFVRMYDEVYLPKVTPQLTAEGDVWGISKDAFTWATYGQIENAVQIWQDGSKESLSNALGSAHKVRSFYHNIYAPNADRGDVTVDTHAVAAVHLQPFSGSSKEVTLVLSGPPTTGTVGLTGMYAVYAEMYRAAAAQRGLLAREMQSITWEAVRGLFHPTFKAQETRQQELFEKGEADKPSRNRQLWDKFEKGKLTIEQVRERLLEEAGGITIPDWLRLENRAANPETLTLQREGGPALIAIGRDTGMDLEEGAVLDQSALDLTPAPVWYSALVRAFENVKANAQPGGQWLAWLRSNSAKLGVKQAEIEANGIEDYLAVRGADRLTKQEILDWFRENGLRVEDVRIGGLEASGSRVRRRRQELFDEEFAARARISELRATLDRPGDHLSPVQLEEIEREHDRLVSRASEMRDERERLAIEEERGDTVSLRGELDELGEQLEYVRESIENLGNIDEMNAPERPDDVSVAEWRESELIRLRRLEDRLIDDMQALEREIADRAVNPAESDPPGFVPGAATRFDSYATPGSTRYMEIALVLPRQPLFDRYFANPDLGHFFSVEPANYNRIAHIRGAIRVLADGRRIFFIEEIQSDWAQKGRERGWEDPPTAGDGPALTNDDLTALADRVEKERKKAARAFDKVYKRLNDLSLGGWSRNDRLKELHDEEQLALAGVAMHQRALDEMWEGGDLAESQRMVEYWRKRAKKAREYRETVELSPLQGTATMLRETDLALGQLLIAYPGITYAEAKAELPHLDEGHFDVRRGMALADVAKAGPVVLRQLLSRWANDRVPVDVFEQAKRLSQEVDALSARINYHESRAHREWRRLYNGEPFASVASGLRSAMVAYGLTRPTVTAGATTGAYIRLGRALAADGDPRFAKAALEEFIANRPFTDRDERGWAEWSREQFTAFRDVETREEARDRVIRSLTEIARAAIRRGEAKLELNTLIPDVRLDEAPLPRAPFVADTKAWVSLAVKRVLRYAADNGLSGIAWTPGEQQIERYSGALRNAVDEIGWEKLEDGKIRLVLYREAGDASSIFKVYEGEEAFTERNLRHAVGGAIADDIINDPKPRGSVVGDGIRFDSPGMYEFYDNILPQTVNDVVKKLKLRTEKLEVEDPSGPGWAWTINAPAPDITEFNARIGMAMGRMNLTFDEVIQIRARKYENLLPGLQARLKADPQLAVIVDALAVLFGLRTSYRTELDRGAAMEEAWATAIEFGIHGMAPIQFSSTEGRGTPKPPSEAMRVAGDIAFGDFEAFQIVRRVKEHLGLMVPPEARATIQQGLPLFQKKAKKEGPRGRFWKSRHGAPRFHIELLENADFSTFLHESAHFFLETERQLLRRTDLPAGFTSDYPKVQAWWASNAASLRREAMRMVKQAFVVSPAREGGWAVYRPNGERILFETEAEAMADVAQLRDAAAQQLLAMDEAVVRGIALSTPAEMSDAEGILRVVMEEQFARGFEQYLKEGKAPSVGLRGIFDRFAEMLTKLYGVALEALGVKLTPEIREVMDRMLATDAEIQQAQVAAGDAPLFSHQTTEQLVALGFTEKQAQRYVRLLNDAKTAANAELRRELLEDVTKREQKWWKKEERRVRELAREAAEAMPVYRAWSALATGKLPDGTTPPGVENLKLDKQAALRALPPTLVNGEPISPIEQLPGRRIYTPRNGADPDVVAGFFGFASGREMLQAIVDAQPFAEFVEAQTEAKMQELHPDRLDTDAAADLALEAIHTKEREDVLRFELQVLATRFLPTMTGLLRDFNLKVLPTAELAAQARETIGQRTLQQLRPHEYLRAEAKASREAQTAVKRGDWLAAIQAKHRQLTAHALYREAQAARARISKAQTLIGRIFRTDKKVAASREMNLVNAARTVLSRVGLVPRRERDRAPEDYLENVRRYDPMTFTNLLPLLITNVSARQDPKTLTVAEFDDTLEVVGGLWAQASQLKQYVVRGKTMTLDAVAGELVASLGTKGKALPDSGRYKAVTEREDFKARALGLLASIRRVEAWVDMMDGGDPDGIWRRYLWEPISAAATAFRLSRDDLNQKYRALLEPIRGTLLGQPIDAPELGYTFKNRAELIGALLHTGNKGEGSNFDKMIRGRAQLQEKEGKPVTWTEANFEAMRRRLERTGVLMKADYDFIQGVWDLLESRKTAAQRSHYTITGYYFREVTATEFDTEFGSYKGGYFPAIADTRLSVDAQLRADAAVAELKAETEMFPTPPRGFTKNRVDSFAAPLVMDLNLVSMHLDALERFIHLAPPTQQVNRLLVHREFREALNAFDPGIGQDMLAPWIRRSAKQVIATPHSGVGGKAFDAMSRYLRSTSSLNAMMGNVINTFQQVTGFSLAAVKVKPRLLAAAWLRVNRSPREMTELVNKLSEFMRGRNATQLFEVRLEIEKITADESLMQSARSFAVKHGYFMQVAAQNYVDNVVWLAAYEQALQQDPDTGRAVRAADAAVRLTQGSFAAEDVSRAATGTPFVRMFTMYFDYFNMQANLLLSEFEQMAYNGLGLKKNAGRALYVVVMGFTIPAVVGEAIAELMRGNLEDDDDDGYLDEYLELFFVSQARTGAAMVPLVGPGISLGVNLMNDRVYDDRVSMSPVSSIVEGAARGAVLTPQKLFTGEEFTKRDVRDVLSLLSMALRVPLQPAGKPIGYLMDVESGRAEPTGTVDFIRGLTAGR